MPRYYFGLYRIPMYEYYWGHTAAQIELIEADAPMICYPKREDERPKGLKPGDKGYRPDPKKLEEAVRRWEKRKAAREKRGFDLEKLLRTGEKVPLDKTTTQTQ